MKKEDLKVGMKIVHNEGYTATVSAVGRSHFLGINKNDFEDTIGLDYLRHYEPVKATKRYWLWSTGNIYWSKESEYMDDDGRYTSGDFHTDNWSQLEKKKHEDEYIDIEEE